MKPLSEYRKLAIRHAPYGQRGKLARQWWELAKERDRQRPFPPPQPGRILRLLHNKRWRERDAHSAKEYAKRVDGLQKYEEALGLIRPFTGNRFITCTPATWDAYNGKTAPEDDPLYTVCPFIKTEKCFHLGRLQNGSKTAVTVTISVQAISGNYLPGLEPRRERQIDLCCVEAAYIVGRERREVGENVRYTVSPVTDTAKKELDGLFGESPCWNNEQ